MDLLPKEMLFEIFQYLSGSDLISLTSVSKNFNGTVSSYPELSRKIILIFRKLNSDMNSFGSRQYSQLKIGFFKTNFHYSVLVEVGANLVQLTLKNFKFKLDTVRRILLLTPKVSQLSFDRVTLSDVPNNLKQPMPRLENLAISSTESDPRLFRVIKFCIMKELRLHQKTKDGFADFSDVIRLLNSQTSMKNLFLDGFCKTNLFADDLLDENFKLESFAVTNSTFQRTVHLKAFVERHADSLTRIEISNLDLCDFSTVLNRLSRLKRLSVSNVALYYLDTLPTVETLEITGHKIDESLLAKTPNVRHLKLKWFGSPKRMKILSEKMTELDCVEVVEGSIDGLMAPKLKRLTMKFVEHLSPDFFTNHHEIEHLEMENCSINGAIIEDIAQSLHILKSLTLINSGQIENRDLETIRDRCEQLMELRVEGSKSLNWNLFKTKVKPKVYVS